MRTIQILQNTSYYDVVFNTILDAKNCIAINMFSFNMSDDLDHGRLVRQMVKLLCKKKMEGVDVKIIFGNSYKSSPFVPFQMLDVSNEIAYTICNSFGIEVAFFNHYAQKSSHSKYVIVDEEFVFIGSHNFSPRAFGIGSDDSVCLQDSELAHRLLSFFNTDFRYSQKVPVAELSEFDRENFQIPTFAKRTTEAMRISGHYECKILLNKEYFETLITEVDKAKTSVDIIMFYFSHSKDKKSVTSRLMQSITKATERGVKVRVILDKDRPTDIYASFKANKYRFSQLKKIGVEVKFDRPEIASHSKVVILDKQLVFTGSHNWTHGSYIEYQDISVCISSTELSLAYTQLFDQRFASLKDIEEPVSTKAEKIISM
jgi:phosphatidylserine/phosphatidylglycerophosphate/cardiolipin synthase-like enzyme